MSSTSTTTAATTAGIRLHPEAERRYRERTPPLPRVARAHQPLIPTGHAGGMWYQLPYPMLLDRGRARASGTWTATSTSTSASVTGSWPRSPQRGGPGGDRRAARPRVAVRLAGVGPRAPHGVVARRAHAVGRAGAVHLGHRDEPARAPSRARVHGPAEAGQGAGRLPRHRRRAGGRRLFDQPSTQRRCPPA